MKVMSLTTGLIELPAVETTTQQIRRHGQAMRRIRRYPIRALVDRTQPLTLQAALHGLACWP
ncbi:hypothetical protein WT83_16340 [Burkholderia territorii]|uniref:Uncharacterized protein n=1 Tax=Burkholderia territorii TaxID=1503055 RepID=A0A119VJD9_9BURK|nr:hypothetical protein WT83_16340 [Burkholderia territorii]